MAAAKTSFIQFVSDSEAFTGSESDSINLTPEAVRKSAGVTWAALDGGESLPTVAQNQPEGERASLAGAQTHESTLGEQDLQSSHDRDAPASDAATTDEPPAAPEDAAKTGDPYVIKGTAGDDELSDSTAEDYIDAGDGNDVIYLQGGPDTVLAGSGDDTVHSGPTLADAFSGYSTSTIFLGEGNDTFSFTNGTSKVSGGAGDDTLLLSASPDSYMLSIVFASDILRDGSQRYSVELTTIWGESVEATGIEHIVFQNGARLEIPDDAWLAALPFGVYAINYETGALELREAWSSAARPSDDWINGTDGDDGLDGGDGNDNIYGGGGDDHIAASAGSDWLEGEDGYDTLDLSGSWSDYVFEYTDAGALSLLDLREGINDGFDTASGFEAIEFSDGAMTWQAFLNRGNESINMSGNGTNSVRAGFGDDTIIGSSGDDHILAGSGSNTVLGGAGDDYIVADISSLADASHNVIDGGDGNDSIILTGAQTTGLISGGAGDDIIENSSTAENVVVYSGKFGEYAVSLMHSHLSDNGVVMNTFGVADQVQMRDGTDTLTGVLTLKFEDGMFSTADGTFSLLT